MYFFSPLLVRYFRDGKRRGERGFFCKSMNPKGLIAIKQVNRKKAEGKTSEFFGVFYSKQKKKFVSKIRVWENGKAKVKHLGSSNDPQYLYQLYLKEAARIYGQPIREERQANILDVDQRFILAIQKLPHLQF